jgi:hypothetical protein
MRKDVGKMATLFSPPNPFSSHLLEKNVSRAGLTFTVMIHK